MVEGGFQAVERLVALPFQGIKTGDGIENHGIGGIDGQRPADPAFGAFVFAELLQRSGAEIKSTRVVGIPFGPLEWVWRSLTYMKRPRLKR